MSGNRNTEEDGGGGAAAAGGGGWMHGWMPLVGAVGGLTAVGINIYQIYLAKKKVEELEYKIRRNWIYDDLEDLLVERQHLFCSRFNHKAKLKELEQEIMKKYSDDVLAPGLKKIFRNDCHCGSTISYIFTRDKRQNGSIMWDQLKEWRTEIRNRKIPDKP